jgi:ribosomal protein S18 acetylase RimI-like enzyme
MAQNRHVSHFSIGDVGSARDIRTAAEALTAALVQDPGWRHVVPDPDVRRRVLSAVLRAGVADAASCGRVVVARTTEGNIVGAAVWLPPGAVPMSVRRKARASLRLLPAVVRDARAMRAAGRLGAAIDTAFPAPETGAFAYLQALGVHPTHARRGIGRALLTPLLAEPVHTYLETSAGENVGYYASLGFALLPGSPAPIYPGGPKMWRMTRPPS